MADSYVYFGWDFRTSDVGWIEFICLRFLRQVVLITSGSVLNDLPRFIGSMVQFVIKLVLSCAVS